jgi:hypothetical protein
MCVVMVGSEIHKRYSRYVPHIGLPGASGNANVERRGGTAKFEAQLEQARDVVWWRLQHARNMGRAARGRGCMGYRLPVAKLQEGT